MPSKSSAKGADPSAPERNHRGTFSSMARGECAPVRRGAGIGFGVIVVRGDFFARIAKFFPENIKHFAHLRHI